MALLLVLWLIVSVPASLLVARMIGRNGSVARTGPPAPEWSELLDRPVGDRARGDPGGRISDVRSGLGLGEGVVLLTHEASESFLAEDLEQALDLARVGLDRLDLPLELVALHRVREAELVARRHRR
jgi:hypothetical protein